MYYKITFYSGIIILEFNGHFLRQWGFRYSD